VTGEDILDILFFYLQIFLKI